MRNAWADCLSFKRKVVNAMVISSEQQALFIACEMERSAVQLYTRAMKVLEQLGREKEPIYAAISQMLEDEQAHLCRFCALYTGLEESVEQQLTLSAIAQGILFEGGLMGAARQGLLKDEKALFALAIESERASAEKYREFAAVSQSEEARDALLRIACEEDGHLQELTGALGG